MAAHKLIDDRRIIGLYKLWGARVGVGRRIAKAVGCTPANVCRILKSRGYATYVGKRGDEWAI